MITSNRSSQSWATKSKFNDIQDYYKEKRNEGYYITDFDKGDNIYSVIVEKECGITDQIVKWSAKFDEDDLITEMWEKDYEISNLLNDGKDWIYVFSRFEISHIQAYSTSVDFPKDKIQKRWDDGYSISKIAYGNGLWIIIFTKGIEYNPGYSLRKKIDTEEINKWISDEKIITDLVYGNEEWAIAYGKHKEYTYQVIEITDNFPADKIRKRWDDGYDITLCAYGQNKWIIAFSTKNKYSTIAKEEERIIKEIEEQFERVKSLYSEKSYSEIITVFENNELLKINEEIVNKYLWALWLNDGTEEKAWDLVKEYSSKFSTSRWDSLKGHYSKWKKWYDFALDYYKDSNEDAYNEVKKIFDDYYTLYEQEKYIEVIEYFENKLSKSVSAKHLKVANNYLWALFKNSGTEKKALEKTKKFLEDYPDNTDWFKLAGHISKWLGSNNKDIELLNEALVFYKKSNNKEKINEVNEKIKELKEFNKKRLAEEKQAEKERLAEEKRVKQEKNDSQHKFKSSRGETFCQYCGKSTIWNDSPCEGKKNGHNYVYMKDSYGNWELQCNKCGRSTIWYDSPCS